MRVWTLICFAAVTAGCGGEAIDTGTRCQVESPDNVWVSYDFDVEVISPAERDCPLALANFGQSQFIQADVSAPVGVPVSPMVWRVFDAEGFFTSGGTAAFGLGGAGREIAQPNGHYPAGAAGDKSVSSQYLNQDRLNVEVGVSHPSLQGVNNVYLPYRGGVVAGIAFTMLPKAKKNRTTTIRIMPNNIPVNPAPKIKWYKNNVLFTPPSNPWGVGGLNGTAYNYAPPNTNTTTWKAVISYGFPETSKTIQFAQPVNP